MASRKSKQPPKRLGEITANLTGILSAFAIAFSGLFLVQDRLLQEQERLLESGGLMELPQTGTTDAAESVEVSLKDSLTESELLQLVHNLDQKNEVNLHEPLEGQLTMIQAIDLGKTWLEEFFLSGLVSSGFPTGEYRASCYLWTPETADTDPETYPWLSCWTVSLNSQNLTASLTLNAVSGQVLDASVSCSSSVLRPDEDSLLALLEKYALSFHLEGDDILISFEDKDNHTNGLLCYQSIGTCGIYAGIQADTLIFIGTDTEISSYMERFQVHLYLSPGLKIH